jgi:hypothetical protein
MKSYTFGQFLDIFVFFTVSVINPSMANPKILTQTARGGAISPLAIHHFLLVFDDKCQYLWFI